MINVNQINQNNNYRVAKPKINTEYSSIKIDENMQCTGDMGKLIPIFLDQLVPSEKVTIRHQLGIQFMPFVANLMHEINGEIMTFAVPNRLLWDGWENYITGGKDGKNDETTPAVKTAETKVNKTIIGTKKPHEILPKTIWDYIGFPIPYDESQTGATLQEYENVMPEKFPFLAYNLIYNECLRFEDIEEERKGTKASDTELDISTATGHWDNDYFTRGRMYQQRGVVPSIPLNDAGQQLMHEVRTQVIGGGVQDMNFGKTAIDNEFKLTGIQGAGDQNIDLYASKYGEAMGSRVSIEPHNLNGLGMNLNDFLIGMGILRFQIANAKIEPRYVDQLQARWGIKPQDARLQRPEYLGSHYFQITCNPVTQTGYGSVEGGQTPQGYITGQAWGATTGKEIEYEALEHTVIMSIMIIKPRPSYCTGMPKKWWPKKKFDYPTPELANTPDVSIKKGELLWKKDKDFNNTHFAWTGIYEEWRTATNKTTGALRPNIKGSLAPMTLCRYWNINANVELNEEFIQCNPDKNRIVQYENEDTFIAFINTKMYTAMPLPLQSEPGDLAKI